MQNHDYNTGERADVGRSTFYSHFRDKEDLFLRDFEGMLEFFVQRINWKAAPEERMFPVAEMANHFAEEHALYLALAKSRKTDQLFHISEKFLAGRIEKGLAANIPRNALPATPLPILAHHLATSWITLLRWWLEHNMPYSPERLDEIFVELTKNLIRYAKT
jgi:AcrR family transcriptional regulator